jgi:putative radical SAM enzyme (TIGR03279 family)
MVLIKNVGKNTPADKAGVKNGDELISINDNEICDVLDYQFYATEEILELKLKRNGEEICLRVEKEMYDDLGLDFETYLMDKKRRCKNGCIFCFIDQNPKGMRETIYFKDDDERLSFLQGNYITLTNLEERDLDRIIKMHISPINVSVHTTDPELRVRMMKNKNAGKVLELMKKLQSGGVMMNAQIVLCRGYNDGEALQKTLLDLRELFPQVQSVAVVPSGITNHRDGLEKLVPFDKESCRETLELINTLGDENLKTLGHRIFFASDEFYLGAELPLPDGD